MHKHTRAQDSMNGYLKKLEPEIQAVIRKLGRLSGQAGQPAYLVGGFVRDMLLGKRNLDVDVAVEGDGVKFAERFASLTRARVVIHMRFGTATVTLPSGAKVDIATARKEHYPTQTELPVVEPGTLYDDLLRRDFTINAMAVRMTGTGMGELIDRYGGRSDLERGLVRILHRESFRDDPTRMLRAVRFEQRLGFRIEPETLRLFKEAACAGCLRRVEPQRLRDELIPLLKEPLAPLCIRRLDGLAGFSFLHPRLKKGSVSMPLVRSVYRELLRYERARVTTRSVEGWVVYLMSLLDAVPAKELPAVSRHYGFRKGDTKRFLDFKAIEKRLSRSLSDSRLRPSEVHRLLEPLSYEVILIILAKHPRGVLQKHVIAFFEVYNTMRIAIKGEDLKRMGFAPGPLFRRLLDMLMTARLDGNVRSKADEIALLQRVRR